MDDYPTLTGSYVCGSYDIQHLCYQSFPCQHYVRKCGGGDADWRLISGKEIFSLLKKDGVSDPHFDKYKKITNPLVAMYNAFMKDKELAEIRENQRLQEKEREKQAAIINKYKASSRLEKLKAKNAIKPNEKDEEEEKEEKEKEQKKKEKEQKKIVCGSYEIQTDCYESFPCQHYVRKCGGSDEDWTLICITNINKMLERDGVAMADVDLHCC